MEPNERERTIRFSTRFEGVVMYQVPAGYWQLSCGALKAIRTCVDLAEDVVKVAFEQGIEVGRAELRPEPTAGDRKAAARTWDKIVAAYDLEGYPHSDAEDIIAAALSAARGDERKECELGNALFFANQQSRLAEARCLKDAIEAKVKALEGAAREFFEAEELEYAAEMRTCPKATIGEINEARNQRKLAHDALAAILEVKA